jgi:hypothetical protein
MMGKANTPALQHSNTPLGSSGQVGVAAGGGGFERMGGMGRMGGMVETGVTGRGVVEWLNF